MYSFTDTFCDGQGILRRPGQHYYDYKNRLCEPGVDAFYDRVGNLCEPGEPFYDYHRELVENGRAFWDGRGNMVWGGYNR